jgi:hypothetical protein
MKNSVSIISRRLRLSKSFLIGHLHIVMNRRHGFLTLTPWLLGPRRREAVHYDDHDVAGFDVALDRIVQTCRRDVSEFHCVRSYVTSTSNIQNKSPVGGSTLITFKDKYETRLGTGIRHHAINRKSAAKLQALLPIQRQEEEWSELQYNVTICIKYKFAACRRCRTERPKLLRCP